MKWVLKDDLSINLNNCFSISLNIRDDNHKLDCYIEFLRDNESIRYEYFSDDDWCANDYERILKFIDSNEKFLNLG